MQKILTYGAGAILGVLGLLMASGLVEARPKEATHARAFMICLAKVDAERIFNGILEGRDTLPEQAPTCRMAQGVLIIELGATVHSARDPDGDTMYLVEALPQKEGYGVAYSIVWDHLFMVPGHQS